MSEGPTPIAGQSLAGQSLAGQSLAGRQPEFQPPLDVPSSAAPRTARRRRRRRWIIAGIVLAVVIALVVAAIIGRGGPTKATVSSALVRTGTLTVVVSADGSTRAASSSQVYPRSSGVVAAVNVRLGSTVAAGDPLFRLVATGLHHDVLAARAGVAQAAQSQAGARQSNAAAVQGLRQAQTSLLQAQQGLATAEALAPSTVGRADQIALAQRQIATAHASITAANASIAAAQSGLNAASAGVTSAQDALRLALASEAAAVVRAPVDGVVTSLNVVKGAAVSNAAGAGAGGGGVAGASSAPVEISNLARLLVRVGINEVDLPGLTKGQSARLSFDARPDASTEGVVSWISPVGTTTGGIVSYDVDLTFTAQDPQLRPGMTATADITTRTLSDVLLVPNAAVKVDGLTNFVEVLDAAGTATRVNITIGASDDADTVVLTGLTLGQRVVTSSATTTTSSGGPFGGRG